ncbi:YoaK family protein [Mesorhizobium sp. SB112]|uniref:YoaK family protein n=1 Tax=Mesorhizobium sp. SB112 TaxID=3151853 RepID=UPI003265D449
MKQLSRHTKLAATGLAFTAGFVDALGFIHLGGYFVSFMTGNSTRMAVSIADRVGDAALPALIIALFVIGVMAGSIAGAQMKRNRTRNLLFGIAALLALSALLAQLGLQTPAILLTPMAMGAMNTIFQRDGEVSVGVTYMTGALVKFAQRAAQALTGGDKWAWAPYLLLWSGLVTGAVCGAALYSQFGLMVLWLPAAALSIFAVVGRWDMEENRV